MAKQRFRLFDQNSGDHISVVEMDESLLHPDAGILDHNTMTLRSIKNGGSFTLLPIDDHTVAVLRRLNKVYKTVTETPARLFSTQLRRVDDLIEAVGLMFGKVEYIVVESKDDIDKLINPPKSGDYEPKKVEYTVMGDMMAKVISDCEEDHVHGPDCNHG